MRKRLDGRRAIYSLGTSAFFLLCVVWCGVPSGPHIELCRSKDKQASEGQRKSENVGCKWSAEVGGKVAQTVLPRVWVDTRSLSATIGLVWWEVNCKSVEAEDLIRYWSR